MKETVYHLLIKSLDQDLGPDEQARLKAALAADADLRAEQAQLLQMRESLAAQAPAFAPFFSTRVMARIERLREQPESILENLMPAFVRLSLPALGLILLMLAFILFSEPQLNVETLAGLEAVELEDVLNEAMASNF